MLTDKFRGDQEFFLVIEKDGDTYTDVYNNAANWEDPTAHTELMASFYDYADGDTGFFRFKLKLNDMSADAVDQTILEDDGYGNIGKIRFRLVHKLK